MNVDYFPPYKILEEKERKLISKFLSLIGRGIYWVRVVIKGDKMEWFKMKI